jgi:hypothetical protein
LPSVVEQSDPFVNRVFDVDWRFDVAKLPVTLAVVVTPCETVVTSAAVVKVRQLAALLPPPPLVPESEPGAAGFEDPPEHATVVAVARHAKSVFTDTFGLRPELWGASIATLSSRVH